MDYDKIERCIWDAHRQKLRASGASKESEYILRIAASAVAEGLKEYDRQKAEREQQSEHP